MSKRHRHKFLQRTVTDDEKWLLYVDYSCKRQWINPKDLPESGLKKDLRRTKVMLSIWWDFRGIVYWELLSRNTKVDAEFYCQQLENLKAALQVNRSERRKV